jgi:hypothetical protein
MSTKEQASKGGENPVSRGRHEHQCRICSHSKREEIEQAFIAWGQSSTESQEVLCQPRCDLRARPPVGRLLTPAPPN